MWRVEKQSKEVESADEKAESEERKYNCAKVRGNVRKVAKCCVFPLICVSAGSKSRLAKAAGAEVAAQSRQETLHAAVARSSFFQ